MPDCPCDYYKDEYLEVALSSSPDVIILKRVHYAVLVHFCGQDHINQHITFRPNDSKLLLLPASDCEPWGIMIAIRWMEAAYISWSDELSPPKIQSDFFTICTAERALRALNLPTQADAVRHATKSFLNGCNSAVPDLKAVWYTLPANSYWIERLLDHIKFRLEHMIRQEKKHKH